MTDETDEDYVRRMLATWANGEASERFEKIIRERNYYIMALEALTDLKNGHKTASTQQHKLTE
jgi:hypothetical protein